MGLFDRTPCDGQHDWKEPQQRTSELTGNTAYATNAACCGINTWGNSPAEAMANAQAFDRAQRGGLL